MSTGYFFSNFSSPCSPAANRFTLTDAGYATVVPPIKPRRKNPSYRTPRPPKVHSAYLEEVVDPAQVSKVATKLAKAIRKTGIKFRAIAFRGMSGALIAPILAYRMRKGLLVVRKPSEESHGYDVEGLLGHPYIIVDDFIGTGKTVRSVVETITGYEPRYPSYLPNPRPNEQCVGIFLYKRTNGDHNKSIAINGRNIPIFGCK